MKVMSVTNSVDTANTDLTPIASTSGGLHSALEGLNESTKWAVSLVVFSVLLWRRDLISAWGVTGSILAAIVCRVLNFVIDESRPPTAQKTDPGMPSAHANSLAFLSNFVSLHSIEAYPIGSVAYLALGFGVPAVAAFLAWLRIALGFHSKAQVAVGWIVGTACAFCWHYLGHTTALPFFEMHPQYQWQLYGATALAVAVFIGQNGARWMAERRLRRQQQCLKEV